MRRLSLFCAAIIATSACSSEPTSKSPNNPSNNGTNSASNNGTNNSTNNTLGNNGTNNNGDCQNNITYPSCREGFSEVSDCPAGLECETEESCGVMIVCARVLDPLLWDAQCEQRSDCEAVPLGCAVDEDCAIVPSGNVCGCLDCPADAINTDNEAAYLAALNGSRALCDSLTPCGDIACIETLPHCDLQTNLCVARESKYVTTNGLPDECVEASDCVAVFEGEVCDVCMCPNEAIPADQVATYQAAFDVDCAHNVACDCAPSEVTCDNGTCGLAAQ